MKIAARRSVALQVAPFGADQIAGPGRQCREGDAVFLVRLLHASVFRLSRTICAKSCQPPGGRRGQRSIRLSSSSDRQTRCGDRLSTVNGPATRMRELSG